MFGIKPWMDGLIIVIFILAIVSSFLLGIYIGRKKIIKEFVTAAQITLGNYINKGAHELEVTISIIIKGKKMKATSFHYKEKTAKIVEHKKI